MNKRPHREKKNDRILRPGTCADEIRRDMLLAPFDGAAREMDLKWGIDRLPELVTVETASIWATTMANLSAALQNGWVEADQSKACADIAACVASALRGLDYMDAEAERLGKPKADTQIMEFAADNGTVLAIARDSRCWQAIKEERPDVVIYTLREVANALEAYGANSDFVKETKKNFPQAEMARLKTTSKVNYAAGGDPIEF